MILITTPTVNVMQAGLDQIVPHQSVIYWAQHVTTARRCLLVDGAAQRKDASIEIPLLLVVLGNTILVTVPLHVRMVVFVDVVIVFVPQVTMEPVVNW